VKPEFVPPKGWLTSSQKMAGLVAEKDWSRTPLGPRADWSPSLTMAVEIILASAFPMALRWGPDFVLIYNDGYRPILGDKHPWALGLPAREAWSEVWPEIAPFHEALLEGRSPSIYAEDMLLRIQRHGAQWEDARFTLSYSPIKDDTAPSSVGGVLVTAVETTARVKAEAELSALNATLEQRVAEQSAERDRLWQMSQALLVVVGADGVFTAANPAWTRMLGWPIDEVVGRRHVDFVHPDDREGSEDALVRALEGPLPPFVNRCMHKDGGFSWIEWVASTTDGWAYAAGRNVTAQKLAEEELRTAQEALCAKARRWMRSASSPAASPMTSTTCWRW
jgi:PAS domain S-box-containing protein